MNVPRSLIDAMAAEVGRLRRRTDPESSLIHLVDRLAGHVETLDCVTHPCAAELERDYFAECGDHDIALDEALVTVDGRARHLRGLLGLKAA